MKQMRENRTSSRSSINDRMQGISEKRRAMRTSIGLRQEPNTSMQKRRDSLSNTQKLIHC